MTVEGRVAWRGPTAAGIAFSSIAAGDGAQTRKAAAAARGRRAVRRLLEASESA